MKKLFRRALDFGYVIVLFALCAYYSVVTWSRQDPVTPAAGRQLARSVVAEQGERANVLVMISDNQRDRDFGEAIRAEVEKRDGNAQVMEVSQPSEANDALESFSAEVPRVHAVATHFRAASTWGALKPERLASKVQEHPSLSGVKVYHPRSYMWPSFLTRANLSNVLNRNAPVAIIAIGMTLVIITAGIDLSVGSLMAVSGVVISVAIQGWAGGKGAGVASVVVCSLLGVAACAMCGAFSGVMVTKCRVPAFIVTLAMMMVGRGLALIIAVSYKSYLAGGGAKGTPEAIGVESPSFLWLGSGKLLGVPVPIVTMVLLFAVAHLLMTRTPFGRYIYAVGGNSEAARLSGVPVTRVLILVYMLCGAMAGLAGLVDASMFEGGRPNAGELYELRAIAAVVVGGASLAGGEGRVLGTFIGALIIATIDNGLNMAGVSSYWQMVVFGSLILAAALVDQAKKWAAEHLKD